MKQQRPLRTILVTAVTTISSFVLFCCSNSINGIAYAQIVLPGAGIINTLAGNGTGGFGGDNGPATGAAVELNHPYGIAIDSSGNVYISDFSNSRIRKITATTGNISTVAGSGTAGFSGDGGPATSAKLNDPASVAVDSAGNIYIADYGNNRIRKVSKTTGNISTVAGNGSQTESGDNGPAGSAGMSGPGGVAVDAAGQIVYIAEAGGPYRVRAVNTGTQTATVATIRIPAGYINSIAGGTICTSPPHDSFGNGCPAIQAQLDAPSGVALDGAGNIYIADTSHHEIRKVTASTGYISVVAGNGTGNFGGDGGPAVNAYLNNPYRVDRCHQYGRRKRYGEL